jgi:hypothetical protein
MNTKFKYNAFEGYYSNQMPSMNQLSYVGLQIWTFKLSIWHVMWIISTYGQLK